MLVWQLGPTKQRLTHKKNNTNGQVRLGPGSGYGHTAGQEHEHGAPLTAEASPAGAVVAAGHVTAAASVHAGVGVALVVVYVAVGAAPAIVTDAVVAVDKMNAVSNI